MVPTRIKATVKIAVGALLGGAALVLGSCSANPVHDSNVDALGPETGNQDEFHRVGQPCTVCHGDYGPAKTKFTVAGTIFQTATGDATGACGAQVLLVDSLGIPPVDINNNAVPVRANCVGNFFTTSDGSGGSVQYNPAFPVKVAVADINGANKIAMNAPINREPSCGKCHQDPAYLNSPGRVNIGPVQNPPQQCVFGNGGQCPVNPTKTCPPANSGLSCFVQNGGLQ